MSYRVTFQNPARKKSKYSAKGRDYNGRWYDSNKEAKYAEELDWRLKSGDIKEWKSQVKISLDVNGVHIANYYCDFRVVTKDGTIQYHEVKGMVLPLWQMKWKLLQALKDEILESGAELIVIK